MRLVTIKQGSIKTVRVTVKRAKVPVDLTGATITMYALDHEPSTAHIADADITILDQGTLTGKFDAVFDESAATNAKGYYRLEVKIIDGSGNPEYLPCVPDEPFGKYNILPSTA